MDSAAQLAHRGSAGPGGSARRGCRGVLVVALGEEAGQVRRGKIHQFLKGERLDGIHRRVVYLGGSIHRDVAEGDLAAADHAVVVGLGVTVIAVAPGGHVAAVGGQVGIHPAVEQPERHVDAGDFLHRLLAGEFPRQQRLLFHVFPEGRDRVLPGFGERQHILRAESARHLGLEHNRPLAVDAGGRHRFAAGDDFRAAVRAVIGHHIAGRIVGRLGLRPGFMRLIGFPGIRLGRLPLFKVLEREGLPAVGAVPPLGLRIERQLGAAVETVVIDHSHTAASLKRDLEPVYHIPRML